MRENDAFARAGVSVEVNTAGPGVCKCAVVNASNCLTRRSWPVVRGSVGEILVVAVLVTAMNGAFFPKIPL